MGPKSMESTPCAERVHAIMDVEITNRCNAHCIMCPREKTPAQGLMEEATFRRVVARVKEYETVEAFVIGGLGEPLVHPRAVEFVRMAAEAGLRPSIITNASLLTRDMSEKLVGAGLRNINVSLGGISPEVYERVQRGLKFETVYRNVLDYLDVAAGRAELNVQISPTEETVSEAGRIAAFWRARGASFCFIFPFAASRGGALSEASAEQCRTDRVVHVPAGSANIEELFRPSRRDARIMHARADFVCYPKDRVTFISWQGNYHLCCNDYEKQHPVGSVYDMSMDEAYARKAEIGPENESFCTECGFSGGDLPPRDARFYLWAASYVTGGAVRRLFARRARRRTRLSDLTAG